MSDKTLSSLLTQVLPHLDPVLLPSPERILELAKQLPSTPRALLEFRLGNTGEQVDLSQCFKHRDRHELETWMESHSGNTWTELKLFVKKLNTEGDTVHSSITDVGLELDLPLADTGQFPLPNLFFMPKKNAASTNSKQEITQLLERVCRGFFDQASVSILIKNTLPVINALPKEAQLNYAALMLARPNVALRLQFHGIHFSRIKGYLQDIGMASIPAALDEAITLASHYFQRTVVCLDLEPQTASRIGLELFTKDIKPEYSTKIFIGQLVNLGLCTEPEGQALAQWPGTMDPGPLLPAWNKAAADNTPSEFLTIQRNLTHIKLLALENQGLQVKAYLEFRRHSVLLSAR